MIHSTLKSLVENEYLFTNLRLSAYCNDILNHICINIKNIQELNSEYEKLKLINNLFKEYKKEENLNILLEIYNLMSSINESKNYLEFNVGYTYKNNNLNKSIEHKIEKFIEGLCYITPEISIYGNLHNFKQKFLECYGTNIEVEFIDVIDSNRFNGLSDLKEIYTNSEREKKIQSIIKNKVTQSLLNHKNVHLTKNDFKNIDNSGINLVNGFDLNLFITEDILIAHVDQFANKLLMFVHL